MNHFKYCVKEILMIKNLIEVENSDFYKRSLARFISIRTDDFIKVSFALNKRTLKSVSIKNDLNALQNYYKEYYKTQRDKFGAHFQDLDFAKRLEVWNQIDIEKTTFFTSSILDIYKGFHELPGYESIADIKIPPKLKKHIAELNSELDIEKYPNFSADILSLTRYNSGGLLHFSKVQNKAAVIKSIEIILNYEIELYRLLYRTELGVVVKKLVITDIVSYCDNLFTRTELAASAKQEENGFDFYAKEANFHKADAIITEFRENFKLSENLDKLRRIRNMSCGHIDTSVAIDIIAYELDTLSLDDIVDFYLQLKKTFKKICREEFYLNTFLIEPEKVYGGAQFVGFPTEPYDPASVPNVTVENPDLNSLDEYERYFKLLFNETTYEEARHFFWGAFAGSINIERITIENTRDTYTSYSHIEFRKAHQFFKDILVSKEHSKADKKLTINLFKNCSSGYPNTLAYILRETYQENHEDNELNRGYICAFGELCSEYDDKIIRILKSNINKSNFYIHYYALLSLFKIDVKSRRTLTSDYDTIESANSRYIKMIIAKSDDFFKITFTLGFLSEIYFSSRLSSYIKPLEKLYITFLENTFNETLKKIIGKLVKTESDKIKLRTMLNACRTRHYVTLIAILGDFLTGKKHPAEALKYRKLISSDTVKFYYKETMELHNFAVVCSQLGDKARAILIGERIVDSNPNDYKYYHFLLCLYLEDMAFKEKFEKTKK